ncbi:voltage-gated hydrogen channel 1 isoform X1 [Pagrus major]|uniref:voltage-gated hydrogen channel 1 isoform X1 n=1 Tax=Pagrus major TaxID=143350 RepID=UPI003CC8C246
MARYLRYFTTVGDGQPAKWEDEELHVASEELSPATGQFPTMLTFRDSLQRLYSSERFQVLVVCLVVLDAIFVLAELLIDLSVIKLAHDHIVPEVFHYLSLALLTFFMVELAGKLYAYRLEFFQHKFEVFDGLVVVVSFILDIVFIFHEDAFDGMGLLILLRLWRVARIINERTSPCLSGKTSRTLPSGQEPRGAEESIITTISPAVKLLFFLFHFCLSWSKGKYSRIHLFQKRSERYCTCLQRLLTYRS